MTFAEAWRVAIFEIFLCGPRSLYSALKLNGECADAEDGFDGLLALSFLIWFGPELL